MRGSSTQAIKRSDVLSTTASADSVINPLDQLSSADIAVQVARITNLYEVASVTNNADSLNSQLSIGSSDQTVVTKPQIVATASKSKKDIHDYITVDGDTISGLASRFNITSDTIRWSNNYTGSDKLPAEKSLIISPISGVVYTVKDGDNPDKVASKFRANKDQLIAFNDAEISGLKVGERIVVPDGSIQAPLPIFSFPFGFSASYGFNGYDIGWCTWYVANRRADLGRPVPANLGNAYSWYILAQRAGLPTGVVPSVGAVMVNQYNNHVAVVEVVNGDGSFWVSEMNSRGQVSMTDPTPTGGWGRIDNKIIGGVGSLKFIY